MTRSPPPWPTVRTIVRMYLFYATVALVTGAFLTTAICFWFRPEPTLTFIATIVAVAAVTYIVRSRPMATTRIGSLSGPYQRLRAYFGHDSGRSRDQPSRPGWHVAS